MDRTILHLCADIGSDSKPYRDAGYNVICVGQKIGVENYHPPPNVHGIIANPPCTHFSIARTRATTPRDLREGMRLVKECLRIIWEAQYELEEGSLTTKLKWWALENPATGLLKNFLGKPAMSYCPSEWGADYTKRTSLWGRFNIPQNVFELRNPVIRNSLASGKGTQAKTAIMKYQGTFAEKRIQQMHDRSKIWEPFAQAFFHANP